MSQGAIIPFKSFEFPFKGDITPEQLDAVEAAGLEVAQVDIPVKHTFLDGVYIREGTLPAGTFAIGHHHNTEHWCVLLTGRLLLCNPDRTETEIKAPCTFKGGIGRKVVYVPEDTLMQNIHATHGWTDEEKADPELFEERLYRKSAAFKAHHAKKIKA